MKNLKTIIWLRLILIKCSTPSKWVASIAIGVVIVPREVEMNQGKL